VRVLNPVGQMAPPRRSLANRPSELSGLRVGLIHNGKPGGRRLLERVGERLRSELGVASVAFFAKPHPSARGDFVSRVSGVIDVAVGAMAD